MGRTCSKHGETKHFDNSYFRKPYRSKVFARDRHRWKDYITADLIEVDSEDVNWIKLAKI
jgi:hypothetical protein